MQHMKIVVLMLAIVLGAPCAHAAEIDRAAMVAAHNKWRAEVGVGKIGYSTQLEASAQAWADHLKKTNACRMQHSKPDGKYGENLYWASAVIWSDGRREVQQVNALRGLRVLPFIPEAEEQVRKATAASWRPILICPCAGTVVNEAAVMGTHQWPQLALFYTEME
jgi:hypothetical protein